MNNIFNKIIDLAKTNKCFKCNLDLKPTKSYNLTSISWNPSRCIGCDFEFSKVAYPSIRFTYNGIVVCFNQNDNHGNGSWFFLNSIRDNDTLYDATRAEIDELQTIEQLYKFLDKIIKIQVFK